MDHIIIDKSDCVDYIWLNRPDVRNAFNPLLIEEITEVFGNIPSIDGPRAVVLGGRGKVFCAGADILWMREMAEYTHAQNQSDALKLAQMLATINACPCPVLGRVQRAAVGGALGLISCCDSVICADDAVFAFTEVRLGISPATIAPYVISKIGPTHARDLMLSGKRFDADRALQCGLVHKVVPVDDLDAAVEAELQELLMAGPQAAAATKGLIHQLGGEVSMETKQQTSQLIADLRVAPEGQEGLGAFLEKRPPAWQAETD